MNTLKRTIRECERHGLRVIHRGKHPRIVNPVTGKGVSFSGTPSCPHAFKHVAKDVKRYLGVVL